jgi:hypothetical protein
MESQEMEQKLNKKEYDQWTKFKSVKNSQINKQEQELIASIHSKYFFHTFFLPCSCTPRQWNQWISDINTLYDYGYRND